MKWRYEEPRRGDIIRAKFGSVYHFGVFVSEAEVIAFGLPPTEENLKNQQNVKVIATDIDAFACGHLIETAQLSFSQRHKRNSPDKTVEEARARIGEGGYNIIHNNCEHFVNEVVFGEKISEQERSVREKWQRFSAGRKQ